jgi:uncharacterized protein (UPF0332 family)
VTEADALNKQLELMIQKAFRSVAAAKQHIREGDYDFASSRAYYAAFYAMQAALLSKGLSFSKHSGVIRAFNQHFIKSATFPKQFGKLISRLFRERQTGDYGFNLSIGKEDAKEDVQAAIGILKAVSKYLSGEGFNLKSVVPL